MDLLSLDRPLTFIRLTVTAESDAKLSDWTSICDFVCVEQQQRKVVHYRTQHEKYRLKNKE